MLEPPRREVADVSVDGLTIVRPPSITFPGFSGEGFDVLRRLRAEPVIGRYHIEKADIDRLLRIPFRAYRDDLVANFVLPSMLDLETEKNVFSRILKNDFGRGAAHHHLWMSFYRSSLTRLTDVQLIHSMHPDDFRIGVFCGRNTPGLIRAVKRRLESIREDLSDVVFAALETPRMRFFVMDSRGRSRPTDFHEDIVHAMVESAGWKLTRLFPRDLVISLGHHLLEHALETVESVWPFYRLMIQQATIND